MQRITTPQSYPFDSLIRRWETSRFAVGIALILAILPLSGGPRALARQDDSRQVNPQQMGLELRPLTAETLGLEMYPPLGSAIQAQRVGAAVTISLLDGAEVPAWSMRIQLVTSTLDQPSAENQINHLLQSWQSAGRQYTVLSSQPAAFANREGQLCYVRHTTESGDAVVVGWLMLRKTDRDFLVFAMQMLPEDFPRVRALLETSFSTIRLRDPEEIIDNRLARVDAGRAFVESLSPERLRSLIGTGQWFRYYMPAAVTGASSDKELGCMYVEFIEAKQGAIVPEKAEKDYKVADQQVGLMARVRGQILDAASGATIDSRAFYWLAWDQSEERWSVQVTKRQGNQMSTDTQTGLRSASSVSDPAGTITVIDSKGEGSVPKQSPPWSTPDPYLSQALKWGLGKLLPRDSQQKRAFSYYFYDGASTSVALRIDEWGPVEDDSGRWKLSSQPKSDSGKTVSLFDENGLLIHRTWPNGSVSVPIALESLQRLWRSKGLGTENLRR